MRRFWFPSALALAFGLAGLLTMVTAAQDQPLIDPLPGQKAKATKGKTTTVAQLTDEEALKKAQLSPDDGPRLIEYLKQRTLSDADQGRINSIIQRFGADDFDDRLKATEEIELFGPAAIGPLKAAEKNSDPEIAYRAKLALLKVEKVPHSAVASAAVRAVVKLKPEGAAAALIGFLPLADDETVANDIRQALVALAVKDGAAEPALIAALSDPAPLRRAAAYVALIEGGPANERIRIKDAYPKVKEAILQDADPEAKFTGLWSLTFTTREKEFLPELINLIPKVGRGRIWQIEDLLLQLAGEHPKDGRFLKSPESLTKARDAWLGWWKEKGERIDLIKFDYKPRITGFTDIIEMDRQGFGQGRIVSLGPDMKEKWRITNVNNPTDMRVTPDGRVYVVESNNNRITQRTTTGTILKTQTAFNQPLNIDLLPDGGLLVICRNNIYEFNKNGGQDWVYARQQYDITTGRRLPNGETLFVTNAYQNPGNPPIKNGLRLEKNKEVPTKALTLATVQQPQAMDVIGENRILVCERDFQANGQFTDRVAEYDLTTGKRTWSYNCPNDSAPTSCQRLPNGNTLICLMNRNQLIEVDPSGEIVWEYQARDGLRVGRGYRR